MKSHKVHFEGLTPKCKRELLKDKNIPVCVRREGIGIHSDFRPHKGGKKPSPEPQPTPTPTPEPTPTPKPNPPQPTPSPSEKGKDNTGAIVGAVLGTVGAVGALGAGAYVAKGSTTVQGAIDRAVANTELGDDLAGFQTAEAETQGFTSSYESISQAGLRNRGVVEMADMTPAEITAAEDADIIGELTIDATTGVAEIVPFEIAGEATAGAVAAEVAGATTAGLLGAVGAIAMGAVGTVGALGYFASNGLFDFQAQANAFQKAPYEQTLAQNVAMREPPKREYVMPPMNSFDTSQTLDYFRRQDEAEARYQTALANYNAEVAKQNDVSSSNPP